MSDPCLHAAVLGTHIKDGVTPTDAQQRLINSDPHSAVRYAKDLARNDLLTVADNLTAFTPQRLREPGHTLNTLFEAFARIVKPTKDIIDPRVRHELIALDAKFTELYGPSATYAQWKQHAVPIIDKIIEKYQDVIKANPRLAGEYEELLEKYAKVRGDVYSQYEHPSIVSKVLNAAVQGPVSAAISNSTMLSMGNLLEIGPKSMAWAVMHSGNDLPTAFNAIFRAIARTVKATEGKPWLRAKELEEQGLYGAFDTSRYKTIRDIQNKLGITDLVDLTENPLRTFTHYLGEEVIGPGGGETAVADNAFIYKWYDKPAYLRGTTNKGLIGLSRFTIGMTTAIWQFAKHAYTGVKNGDLTAAYPIVAFSLIQSLQTGASSAIPGIFWGALTDEQKESIRELDSVMPLNMIGKITGQDYSDFARLSIVRLGLPAALLEGTIKSAQGGAKFLQSGLLEGDPTQALAGSALIMSALAATAPRGLDIGKWNIPHWAGNFQIQRVFREIAKASAEEIEWEDLGTEYLKDSRILNPMKE